MDAFSPLELPVPRRVFGSGALAVLVIAVVALMIVPLPTPLLDLLIASNLALSVTILLVSLQVNHALKIATFPTILLLTTLVRLALNVSSTRLILLQANAGEVIQAFGQFVVRGNYVVGAVIFLILTIIQFVVIAKGSERVAEVGARFTLDAMPGKQMAIDAELRAGSIDGNEARRRRQMLGRESQFYGAMDGAMKFVKGDVVASFLITLINLLGGLAIGVGQRGMDSVSALKRYGLLTIGDGLVSQIPALVIATAAGVLVTRVASEEAETSLGDEIFSQMFAEPRALRAAGIFVALLGVVPGLPALPFLVIGALLSFAAYAGQRKVNEESGTRFARVAPKAAPGARYVPGLVPWSITVGRELEGNLRDTRRGSVVTHQGIESAAIALGDRLFHETGVPLPRGRVHSSAELEPREVVLRLHEIRAHAFRVPEDTDDVGGFVSAEVLPFLRARAAEFLGLAETQALLDGLEASAPGTVHQVVPKPLTVVVLSEVLRRLVMEQVSVRDLKSILEALASIAVTEKDPALLAEYVRAELRRPITHALTNGRPEIDVYLLQTATAEAIRGAITRTSAGLFLTLSPAAGRDITRGIQHALRETPAPQGRPLVLLTDPDIRRFVRKLVELDLPELAVVSFAELQPEVRIKPLARISPA